MTYRMMQPRGRFERHARCSGGNEKLHDFIDAGKGLRRQSATAQLCTATGMHGGAHRALDDGLPRPSAREFDVDREIGYARALQEAPQTLQRLLRRAILGEGRRQRNLDGFDLNAFRSQRCHRIDPRPNGIEPLRRI